MVKALPASILGVGCYNIKSPKKGSPQYFAQYFLRFVDLEAFLNDEK